MQAILKRVIYPNGTNGTLTIDNEFICYTIELPWKENKRNVSCISPGTYTLKDHKSPTFGRVAYVIGTQPQRDFVYFHAANNALTELRGCIAPVTTITGEGKGSASRNALKKFNDLVFAAFDRKETVYLTII